MVVVVLLRLVDPLPLLLLLLKSVVSVLLLRLVDPLLVLVVLLKEVAEVVLSCLHFLLLVFKVAAEVVVVVVVEVEELVDNVFLLARQHSSRTYSAGPPRTRTMATTIPTGDTMGSIIIPEMLTRVIFSMV